MSGNIKLATPSGGSVTLSSADTASNLTVTVPAVTGYVQAFALASVQTANFTAVAWTQYPVNTTSAAVTVTLPASPTAGQQVNIFDYAGTAATNNITINPNGGKIEGVSVNAVLSVNRQSTTLVFVDSTQGWSPVSSTSTSALMFPYSITYVVVAGGGGGGYSLGGGGGAGGYRSSVSGESSGGGSSAEAAFSAYPGTSYSVVVGAGAAGQPSTGGTPTNGSNSSFGSIISLGGGGGSADGNAGGSGGSGGGCRNATAGSGTTGQGYAGATTASTVNGSGGGGAGAVGQSATSSQAGAGGIGVQSSITGSATYYAGGGGGGGDRPFRGERSAPARALDRLATGQIGRAHV